MKVDAIDFQQTYDNSLMISAQIKPMVADTIDVLHNHRKSGDNILFEGAQGSLLDIDHGTYPFVTSSTTTAGGAAAGSGVGPRDLEYILGIVKAYTTRVGAGPFPTELDDENGQHMGKKGHEFGATTGRKRRCGWLDMVALKRSFKVNSVSGLCITKLDVLDGLETIKIAVGYRHQGHEVDTISLGAESLEACEPVYLEMPGWQTSTQGIKSYDKLPATAINYLKKIEELGGVPIDIISTGPDRLETIVLRHPFSH